MSVLRVLVVDDSRQSRERIVKVIERMPDAEVVGVARNGADALRLSRERSPDAVTLDLEMPEMGGFSFLRVLMGTRPLPVVVVSNNNQRENIIRALELGALDFIGKGEHDEGAFATLLSAKLTLVRAASVSVAALPAVFPAGGVHGLGEPIASGTPVCVVAIAASTGGPGALSKLVPRLERGPYAVVIVQHIPPRFTTAIAERLDAQSSLDVSEAENGKLLTAGSALVCPGDRSMELVKLRSGRLQIRLVQPGPDERYVPSASRLFASVGRVMGRSAVGVVLTGMGDDGADGARVIADRGGKVLVESAETAVIHSMPKATLQRVPNATSVPLTIMPERVLASVRRLESSMHVAARK